MAKRTYNRRGRQHAKTPVTSSKRRPQRIKGAQTARRTGSKDKMTVSGQRNIKGGPRGAQGPRTPPQQGPERAVKGLIGSRGASRSKPPIPKPPKAPGRFTPKPSVKAKPGAGLRSGLRITGATALAGALSSGSLRNPVTKAKEAELRRKEAKAGKNRKMASRGKNYKSQEKELSRKASASNFDRAFAAARKAGKKTFIWRGKKYTTKTKK